MLAPDICPRCDFTLAHSVRANRFACPECGLAFDDPDLIAFERASPSVRLRGIAMLLAAVQLIWIMATLADAVALYRLADVWPIRRLSVRPDTLLVIDVVRWACWAILLTMLAWRPIGRGTITRVWVTMAAALGWMAVGGPIWRIGEYVTWQFDPLRTSVLIGGIGLGLTCLRALLITSSDRDGRIAHRRASVPWILSTALVIAGSLLAPSFHEMIRQSAALLAVVAVTAALDSWARRYWHPRFRHWLTALRAAAYLIAVGSVAQAFVERPPGISVYEFGPRWLPASTWLPLARAVVLAAAACTIPLFVDAISARYARTWTRVVPDQIAAHRRQLDRPELTRRDRWAVRVLMCIAVATAFVLAMHRTDLIGLTSAPQSIPVTFVRFALFGTTVSLAILARPLIARRTPGAFVLAAAVWSGAALTIAACVDGVAMVRSGATDLLTEPAVLIALGLLGMIAVRTLHVASATARQAIARLFVTPLVVFITALLYGLSTTLSDDTRSHTILLCVVLGGTALVIRRRLPPRTAVIRARLIRGLSTWVIGACLAHAFGQFCARFMELRTRIAVSRVRNDSDPIIASLGEALPRYATIVLVVATLLLVVIAAFATRSRPPAARREHSRNSVAR